MTSTSPIAQVALDVPLPGLFDYLMPSDWTAQVGDWVVVPWGRSRRVGLVAGFLQTSEIPAQRLRPLESRLPGMPRLTPDWLGLVSFAARYYHVGLGELALPAVPKLLRTVPTARSRAPAADRARERFATEPVALDEGAETSSLTSGPSVKSERTLTVGQSTALNALLADSGPVVHLIHGITGSGKTEVYFRWIEARMAVDPASQALILVPEIALTPEFARRIRDRFPALPLAILHSDMPDAERAAHWLAAAEGRARIVLGTRLAVLAPLPGLVAIVVDEEHDASFKQQEGARYSARDLAIALGARRGLPVVLGSATPSLESWHAARRGRYRLSTLPERAGGAALPTVTRLPLAGSTLSHGLTAQAIAAVKETVSRGEQALVFLNRRGYAPVLSCSACGWLSRCELCDAYRVMHRVGATSVANRSRYRLICHHCASDRPVPKTCPECGNVDLAGLGQGTQRLEEGLSELFEGARIGRLDRDVARRKGAAQSVLDAAHAGEVDVLVGTQMLAKGHDFRRLTLVVVVDADAALFAADFRAPERLFATLMQVAGRAGRHLAGARVLIQTRFPQHPVYEALAAHDYPRFAQQQLDEREQARLPPFVYQALLTAQARGAEQAHAFLATARSLLQDEQPDSPIPRDARAQLTVCDPVPMPLAQLRGQARAQMLIESASRPALHAVLGPWIDVLHAQRSAVRWQLVVDPLEI